MPTKICSINSLNRPFYLQKNSDYKLNATISNFHFYFIINNQMQSPLSKDNINVVPHRQKSVTASKKTYEWLWKVIFLALSIISAFMFKKIYEYQTIQTFDHIRKGQFINLIIYGLPFAFLFTIFDMLVHFFFDDLCEKYYIDHNKYTDPEARKKRCYTLVKWGYSVLYYALSSFAAFILLRKTSYFPKFLGGTGSPYNIFNDFPENSEFSFQIEVFYILQFGKHFSRTFGHLFIRPQGNYYQYALHHGLSIFLIFFSYTMDQWLIGTFVLSIHDITDLTLILARAYRVLIDLITFQEYKNRSEKLLKYIYVQAFFSWVMFRIVIYSYSLIYCLWSAIFAILLPKLDQLEPIYKDALLLSQLFMAVMLLMLEGLQLFWTYYILKSYIAVNVSEKLAKHTYD